MASLQAKHQKRARIGKSWTTFRGGDSRVHVPRRDRPITSSSARDRRTTRRGSERTARSPNVRFGRSRSRSTRATYQPQQNIAFDVWAERWLESLERKRTTVDSYRGTINHARRAFRSKRVRDLRPQDIADFNAASARRRTHALDTREASARLARLPAKRRCATAMRLAIR